MVGEQGMAGCECGCGFVFTHIHTGVLALSAVHTVFSPCAHVHGL